MKKFAGIALIVLILAAAAALFRYALTGGSAAPAAPSPAAAPPPPSEAAPPPAGPAPDSGSEEVLTPAPLLPDAPPPRPAAPPNPAGLSAAGQKLSGEGVITSEAVNLRSTNEYRTDKANVVAKLGKGDKVRLLGVEKERNGPLRWYHVKTRDGKTGWVREDLIKVNEK